ncbi:alpha/beta fold hydrolase [Robertkochia flava]|uniref:alpha/beta fold hydrolase n=1 Tax=Robertkochia flava TaxID=3447986 RepID=UPI001CCA6E98|nr:alpha/beta hydrolase [Robertkochia marina]
MPESASGKSLIPVYMMPGMAANPSIFEHVKLPEDRYEVIWLHWKLPREKETLVHYAQRMCKEVKHKNPVLMGVSFGGILVQEMSKLIPVRKLIVISSVKCRDELPYSMRVARKTYLHKLLPTSLVNNVEVLAKYAFGESVVKRLKLYERYLSVRDKRYLDWAIDQVVNWEQEKPIPGTIHIQGDRDPVFPADRIKDCIWIKGGTHIMIINRFKWFNEHLPELISGK